MELIFRKIEYLIEGDAKKQKKLDAQVWNIEKVSKKTLKYVSFYIVSLILANIVFTYLIGAKEWLHRVNEVANNLSTVFSIVIFASIIFVIYSLFREHICIIVCPYGRLQGILIDSNTVVVAYDYIRGEPRRGTNSNQGDISTGDCINCGMCVDVCPTGIDIRNGTQLECVNCTACIDSCNTVMKKLNKPTGLIRFSSERLIKERSGKTLNFRAIAYSFVLSALIVFLVFLILNRKDIETTILRTPGTYFQENVHGEISNLYNIKIINKTNETKEVSIVLNKYEGRVEFIGSNLSLPPNSVSEGVFFLYLDKRNISEDRFNISFKIYAGNKYIETVSTTFIAN